MRHSRRLRSRDQGLLRRATPCFSHTALFQRERSALASRRCPSMAAVGNCMAALSSEPSALHKHQRPLRCAQQRAFVFVEYSRQRSTLPCSFPHSTIDGSRLNFRVRNGNGCGPAPVTTGNSTPELSLLAACRRAHCARAGKTQRSKTDLQQFNILHTIAFPNPHCTQRAKKYGQAARLISTS